MVSSRPSTSTRRRFLTISATCSTGLLSGCSRLLSQSKSSNSQSLPTLCGCKIKNYHNENHTIHVLIERGDRIMHWSQHDLKPDEIKSIELGSWHKEPGRYIVSGSFDELTEWGRRDLTQVDTADCLLPSVEIMEGGDFRVVALL